MAIYLNTLGGVQVYRDGVELERLFSQRVRAALFVYLAVERQVSREVVTALFWAESSSENARHALRQSLYQLRRVLGEEWVESHPHEVRVGADVRTDVDAFATALERGDAEAAARLYRGAFLDGVNLVDSKAWESWVDGRRAQYARDFRRACREWLEARRDSGDARGAIEAAQLWVSRDPFDDEAQHRLVEALAEAGERTEAIRQYETYTRLLEPEGLRPLDETVELAERVRSEAAAWPDLGQPPEPPSSYSGPDPPRSAPVAWTRRTWRWLRVVTPVALVVLILALALTWAGARPPGEIAPTASGATLAVLPFSVRGGDDARYLSEGMVNLLATALDGAASVRPVDARAVFAMLEQTGGTMPGIRDARRLASRLDARLFVLGDVVQVGDWLQIEAAVYDAAAVSAPLERAAVSGAPDRVFELVDQLAARLLAGLGDASADRLFRTAAVTTGSLPAFKSYLLAEKLMRAGQFERAAETFQQAIAGDSGYALAHYRLALAREWAPLPGTDEAAGRAARHAGRLAPRDRALLEAYRAWRAGNAAEAERGYRAILARYPDDVEAWFQLGEILFHYGGLLGRPLAESEAAWRRVLDFEPRNLFAVPHVARIAAAERRVATVDSLVALFSADELFADRRLLEVAMLQALAGGDSAAARPLVDAARRWEDLAVWRLAAWITSFTPDPAALRPVLRDLNEDHRGPATRADLLWFASILHLASGQVRAARNALDEASRLEAMVPPAQRRRAFAHVTAWFAATLPLPYADSTLMRARRDASSAAAMTVAAPAGFENEMGMGRQIQLEPVRHYTLGLLSHRLEDMTGATTAAAALARLAAAPEATAFVQDLDRGLRAGIAWHDGRAEDALRLLQSLEHGDPQGDLVVIPFASRAHERWLRAEVLASLGRDNEALAWLATLGHGSVTDLAYRAPAYLRQAEIHERLGNRSEAVRHYSLFVELWDEADVEFQPVVEEARRRLGQLQRSR